MPSWRQTLDFALRGPLEAAITVVLLGLLAVVSWFIIKDIIFPVLAALVTAAIIIGVLVIAVRGAGGGRGGGHR